MSKFFKQTQKANGRVPKQARHENHVLEVEKLLKTIHQNVDEQVAGVEAESSIEAVLDFARESSAPNCAVAEFSSDDAPQVQISRESERVFFPDNGTTPAPPALEGYRSLRTRLLRLQVKRNFRTVAISSAGKGEGKTLTTLNLALCCAQLPEYPVLVIDGDLRGRGLSRLLGNPDVPGLSEMLAGQATRDDIVLATDIPNLYVVGAGNDATPPPELFARAAWKEFAAWCKESFDLVLIDAPPVLPLADFELISGASESVMMVVRARVAQRDMLEKALAHIDPAKLLGATFNSVDHTDGFSYKYDYQYGTATGQRSLLGRARAAFDTTEKRKPTGGEPKGL